MRKIFQWFMLAGFFVMFSAGGFADTSNPDRTGHQMDQLPKVLLIGDSISIGYTQPVRQKLEGVADVSRVPGNAQSTKHGLKYIDKWLGKTKWDVIHFNFGLHDIKHLDADGKTVNPGVEGARRQVDPKQYEANLHELVKRMKASGAKLIWRTTTPVPEGASARVSGDEVKYNEIAARVMAENNVPTDDLYSFALPRLAHIQLERDVHYMPHGSETLAGQVARSIAAVLRGEQPRVPSSYFLPSNDECVKPTGKWFQGGNVDGMARNRYTWPLHQRTKTTGDTLDLDFEGVGISIIFHTPRTRAYGRADKDAKVSAHIDGQQVAEFFHDQQAMEVVLADGLEAGKHHLTFTNVDGACTVMGFRVMTEKAGHASGVISADNPDYLFDVRVKVFRNGQLVRSSLNRNWLSNRFAITGLSPGEGYRVRIEAVGWETWEKNDVTIAAGRTLDLGEIHLKQDPATIRGPLASPAQGYQQVKVPGESVVVEAGDAVELSKVIAARLTRPIGDAVISRKAPFAQGAFVVPTDTPAGVYDLELTAESGVLFRSPRSVVVRAEHAKGKLRVLTWGHTDTWGQHQAEFERTLFDVANVIGPDLVLTSNAINPGHIAGAGKDLRAPYLINFGNHRLRGHEAWYGDQVGMIDFGPNFAVFNFGHPWKEDASGIEALMASRSDVTGRILNTYEADIPVEILQRHDIRLMHDAHGWLQPRVQVIPDTQTMRVGKVTASSFRIVKMEDHRVVSVTDPYDVKRVPHEAFSYVPPAIVRVDYSKPAADLWRADVVNGLPVALDAARVVFLVPAGEYEFSNATAESKAVSDDGNWVELIARLPIDAESNVRVELRAKR